MSSTHRRAGRLVLGCTLAFVALSLGTSCVHGWRRAFHHAKHGPLHVLHHAHYGHGHHRHGKHYGRRHSRGHHGRKRYGYKHGGRKAKRRRTY